MQKSYAAAGVRPITLIPFGSPGAGKSNLLNKLIGKEGRFESSRATNSGLTKNISYEQGPAFGKPGNPLLRVYDAPGVGDFNIPLPQIVADIKVSIGSKQHFDAALVVVKMTDYRATIQEVFAIKAISKLLVDYKPENIFMVVTHCDLEDPPEELIKGKLQSFKETGGIEIPLENVVKFNNTEESLLPMLERIRPANMHFHEKIEDKAEEIIDELPGDFRR